MARALRLEPHQPHGWSSPECCAWLWDNFHQAWPSTTYRCLNYGAFDADTLCHAVTLTFDPLTLKVRGTSSITWSKSVRNLSEIEQSPGELLIILRIFCTLCHAVTLTFDLLILNFYSISTYTVYRIWAKWNNPPLSYWRFSTFSPCNFRGGAFLSKDSQGCMDPTSLTSVMTYER